MSKNNPVIEVIWRKAPFLPEAKLWLDPHGPCDFAFVSHAHADHFAPHGKILCSEPTARIIEKRFGNRKSDYLILPFGEVHQLDDRHEIQLLPAGHTAGSAQIFVRNTETGASLLYTGDFKMRPSAAAEPIEFCHADTLIMETTFGIPKFTLPPTADVIAQMVKFARETLEDGDIPFLMGYSLGKAQEIILAVHAAAPELEFQVHKTVEKMNAVVGSLGWKFPECQPFEPKKRDPVGHVIVIPPNSLKSQEIRRIKNKRAAMMTGWGIDSNARYRYQCDEVFPLTDHADYPDLHTYVEAVNPHLVYTLHGYASQFATELRAKGREAWSLISANQTELKFDGDVRTTIPKVENTSHEVPRPESGFGRFVETCEAVRDATGKLKKQAVLAEYLRSLTKADELQAACLFLTGSPLSKTAAPRTVNTGWAIIRRVIREISGLSETQYRQISTSQADSARTSYIILQGHTNPEPHKLSDIARLFENLAAARGSAKISVLKETLSKLHHAEAAMVVGILGGDLRIGLKEGLLEESIAAAFDREVSLVREAHMLTGDPGKTALLARDNLLSESGVTPFHPLKVMLASPEPDAEGIWKRLSETEGGVWLEDKYDGIRAQLHKVGDRVEIYSRDQRALGKEFAELFPEAQKITDNFIFDGEIIAYAAGKKLTFFDLQKRLGRLDEGDLFFGESIPVTFLAFDVLWHNGESLIKKPLIDRVSHFDQIGFDRQTDPVGSKEGDRVASADSPASRAPHDQIEYVYRINPVASYRAQSTAEIDDHFYAARKRDNEGLIAKDPNSAYSPGRRGKSWLKLKKATATLDCVVVKAQLGHGKRTHVLSDYTFAIRDEQNDQLRVLGKAYSGLTDLEIEELTEHFKANTLEVNRRVHTVEPNIVLEIAFDSIQPSKRHDSGLSLRFPRIKAIRRDKTIADIDTMKSALKLIR